MAAKYVLKKTTADQFVFHLQAGNGEIILSSESYTALSSAKAGIESVRKNSPLDERYERKTSRGGQPFFVLKAGNGEPIGTSEMYGSVAAMENGISSVQKNGSTEEVRDDT